MPTYPAPFLKYVAAGPMYTGVERWSFGLNFMDVGGSPPSIVADDVVLATYTFLEAVSSPMMCKWDSIKINEIGTDGKYTSANTVERVMDPPEGWGTSGITVAPQVALAVTLDTGYRRGYAAQGRFFIPGPKYVPAADGRIQLGDATAVATAATTFINSLHTALPGYRLCVASGVAPGRFREVQSVRVGRVLDTIRSRRTSLPEDHVSGAELSGFSGDGGGF